MAQILILGAGRVARPCVQYLLNNTQHMVTVVDISEGNLKKATAGHPRSQIIVGDAASETEHFLEKLKPDIVINLLPAQFMPTVAKKCIQHSINYVDPSYIKEEMRSLDQAAKEKGVLLLCELGLDPGIDHMSAAKTIKSIHDQGGIVESFWSCCGALPSLCNNNNPFGYKLSWSPEALIGASKRTARFLKNGEIVVLPDGETYKHPSLVDVEGLGCFEEYANADSIPYIDLYGIKEAKEVYRGTFRYPGWCELIAKMNELGLFETTEMELKDMTYREFMAKILGINQNESVKEKLCSVLGRETFSSVFLKLEWLGLLSDEKIPLTKGSPRSVIASLFHKKLVFSKGEKDLVVMEHRYVVNFPEKKTKKLIKSTLVCTDSVDGDTAIAKTTGTPPAIGAMLILEGKVKAKGVQAPVLPEIYEPSLELLEKEGITFTERETIIGD